MTVFIKINFMKHEKLFFAIIVSICLLSACSDNNSKAASRDDAGNFNSAHVSSSNGSARYSANLDRELVSGGKIDDMQLQNTAFIYPTTDNKGKKLLFYLFSDKNGDNTYTFMFGIPGQLGSFTKNLHDG